MNVNDLLRSLAEDRRSLAAKQGLQLETKISSDLPEILGDERLLSQVFTNLLTNAMNYTQEGGELNGSLWMSKTRGWASHLMNNLKSLPAFFGVLQANRRVRRGQVWV
jgi:signal transduction histidine kinase